MAEESVRELLKRYDLVLDDLRDRGDTDFVWSAVDAPYHVLISVLPNPEYDGVAYAIDSASSAVEQGDRVNGDTYIEEELNWQLKAIATASGWQSDTAQRGMFEALDSTPVWLEAFGKRHPSATREG